MEELRHSCLTALSIPASECCSELGAVLDVGFFVDPHDLESILDPWRSKSDVQRKKGRVDLKNLLSLGHVFNCCNKPGDGLKLVKSQVEWGSGERR